MSNQLQNAHSPYLLQHATNPVNWEEWSPDAFQEAQKQNKLVIVSIGYSSCHWCHVMAHESFEDLEVARYMNLHFINIKVDREERPDVDQVYMNAAMIIHGNGGWPLNAITLPDGRPLFVGTYFPKDNWLRLLNYFNSLYQQTPDKLIEQAQKITQGLKQLDFVPQNKSSETLHPDFLLTLWERWKISIDKEYGGRKGAPKFIMPANFLFLLKYAHTSHNSEIDSYIQVSLEKVALGGINDAVSGGFARYSTDSVWHIPHFEKMLYDNAQLLSVYAQAYRYYQNPLYREVIYQILHWLAREMKATDGGYFAALDADSEGVEGKYYTWTWQELKDILGKQIQPFATYYHCAPEGNWENGQNHLHSEIPLEVFCKTHALDYPKTQEQFEYCKSLLQNNRQQRVRPGLDNKRICEWNAMLVNGFIDAYWATQDVQFLESAQALINFIEQKLMHNNKLWHTYNQQTSYLEGYLSDYATAIFAYIRFYQATFKEKYLSQAKIWLDFVLVHFKSPDSPLFYLTSDLAERLVHRPIDKEDNVIPSSNSILAHCLFLLGHYYDEQKYLQLAEDMLQSVLKDTIEHGAFYANWASLLCDLLYPPKELVLTSDQASQQVLDLFSKDFLPHVLPIGSDQTKSNIPLLEGKTKPLIYICSNRVCQAPLSDWNAVRGALKVN